MIPTRCPVCDSWRVFLDGDRLLCHDCGEPSYWEFWLLESERLAARDAP